MEDEELNWNTKDIAEATTAAIVAVIALTKTGMVLEQEQEQQFNTNYSMWWVYIWCDSLQFYEIK